MSAFKLSSKPRELVTALVLEGPSLDPTASASPIGAGLSVASPLELSELFLASAEAPVSMGAGCFASVPLGGGAAAQPRTHWRATTSDAVAV